MNLPAAVDAPSYDAAPSPQAEQIQAVPHARPSMTDAETSAIIRKIIEQNPPQPQPAAPQVQIPDFSLPDSLLSPDDYHLPPSPPPASTALPSALFADGPVESGVPFTQAADPQPPSLWPPQREMTAMIGIAIIAATALILWKKPTWRSRLMTTLRRRAALVICLGIGIVAASLTVAPNLFDSYEWEDFIKGQWLTFIGSAIALIGIFHWISGPPDMEK